MDENDIKESWLQENSIECPAYTARISVKQCEFLRSLPAEGTEPSGNTREWTGHRHAPRVRDIACDSCTSWKAKGADSKGKTTGTQRNIR